MYVIRTPNKEELGEALKFINSVYRKRYKAPPLSSPDKLCVAFCGNVIVGTIGLNFCKENGKLPLEEIYEFKSSEPKQVQSKFVVEYLRWTAKIQDPPISNILAYIATIHALSKNLVYGMFESKLEVAQKLIDLGADLQKIPTRVIKPLPGHSFYTEEPLPQLYLFKLEQMKLVLSRTSASVLSSKKVIVDFI